MAYTRTHKYLYPSLLLGYDRDFGVFLTKLGQKGVIINSFLGDMTYDKITNACIFVLIQTSDGTVVIDRKVCNIRDYFFTHKSYKDDYVSEKDKTHMFVFECPDETCYNWFVMSRYSKMYKKDFLDKHFKDNTGAYLATYHVLAKTEAKRLELIEEYGFSDDFSGPEFDSKIKMQDEIFNFQLSLV